MDEESFEDMKKRQLAIITKLNQLIEHTIQEKKDVSELMKEIKELVVKGKPPRKQPKKKGEFRKALKEEETRRASVVLGA